MIIRYLLDEFPFWLVEQVPVIVMAIMATVIGLLLWSLV